MLLFFVFKKKTAYEMRISDWSSDVCSSDLVSATARSTATRVRKTTAARIAQSTPAGAAASTPVLGGMLIATIIPGGGGSGRAAQIGRASCRERVCQYV